MEVDSFPPPPAPLPEVMEEYLENHPEFIQKWLLEKASKETVKEVLSCCSNDDNDTHQEKMTMTMTRTSAPPPNNNNNNKSSYKNINPNPPEPPPSTSDDEATLIQRNRQRSKRNSITSDRFQSFVNPSSSSPKGRSASAFSGVDRPLPEPLTARLESLDENALFMELVKDISNELDIDVLCHKILVNVGFLTHAEKCNLYLARGPLEQRYLVTKLIDVTTESDDVEECLKKARKEDARIALGAGIVGHVAQTKEIINITDTQDNDLFAKDVQELGKRGNSVINCILAVPVTNNEGDVIGVAQLINKKSGNQDPHYTAHDIEVLSRYLTFCGIGIQNAQLFDTSVSEYRRNQLLLNLARSIFEEQTSLERLVTKIMKEAQALLKCERCLVYLRDIPLMEASHIERILMMPSATGERKPLSRRESKTVTMRDVLKEKGLHFELVFELSGESQEEEMKRPSSAEMQSSPLTQIAKYVATNSEILNIGDAITWYRDSVDQSTEILPIAESSFYNSLPKSILCMPIYNGQRQVIGVAQLINKRNNQPFTDSDANTFEAFAIFCGLGIHNTQLYESACKLMAKQSVALECLSYHATASQDDTERLRRDDIPSSEYYNLHSYIFNDFHMTDSDTCKATIRMFLELNLVTQFHIPYPVLCRWVLSVKKNYRPVKYHNWRHAFNVAQSMFTVLTVGRMGQFLEDLDILGLMVACLCHDLDHRGTNNAFQTASASPLAVLYSTSTMEHHHFDQCVMILSSEGNNIFQDLSAENYRKVMKIVEKSILSTDLAMYFRKKDKFIELVENGEISWQGEDKKELLGGMMMTACDVAAIAKPWEIQHKIAKLVADEFFDQGDLEKVQLNQQPQAMMDRDKKDELPKMQLSFIDVICTPLYSLLSETFPWLKPLYDGVLKNRRNWQDLAEKVDMGLTWIDYDVIEKPVEEFTKDTEPEDIDFVVQNLNCPVSEGDGDANRRNKTKWKLTRLFRESSQLRKSTSVQSKSSEIMSPQYRKDLGDQVTGTTQTSSSISASATSASAPTPPSVSPTNSNSRGPRNLEDANDYESPPNSGKNFGKEKKPRKQSSSSSPVKNKKEQNLQISKNKNCRIS